jgi:hypothetical protein
MTVRIEQDVIHLEGQCRVEEAEALLVAFQEGGARIVDVGQLGRLHLSLVQILLAWRPEIRGVPGDPFLRDRLLPLLRRSV